MNVLAVGTNIHEIILDKLSRLSGPFLLVDDGPIIDDFILRTRRKYTELDFSKDSFNPLTQMNDQRAEEIVAILDDLQPGGESTLTRRYANHLLFKTLVEAKPRTLQALLQKVLPRNPKDTDRKDAAQKVERVLLVDVLHRVFETRQNFSVRGILLARINRAELGDFASRALAYFLIARYPARIVVPAFGFYGRPFHASLIQQNRLIAGVNFLHEVDPPLRNRLLLIHEKIGRHCTPDDAEILAQYCGMPPQSRGYREYKEDLIK